MNYLSSAFAQTTKGHLRQLSIGSNANMLASRFNPPSMIAAAEPVPLYRLRLTNLEGNFIFGGPFIQQ